MRQASALYRLLGDEARLRLLRVLRRERLNVTELTGSPRARAVRRVAPSRPAQGRRARRRRDGRGLHLLPAFADAAVSSSGRRCGPSVEEQFDAAAADPAVRADEARLQEVLRLRKENFETHGAADTRDARQLVPGRSWAAWSRALGMLLPPLHVADLGCGEGYLTIEAARWASRVVAVDRSDTVLDRARALARRRRVVERHVEARRARASCRSRTAASTSRCCRRRSTTRQDPARAVAEAARITAPGGRVLVLDLRQHQEEWVRAKLGDRALGFRDDELQDMLTAAGLPDVKVGVGARKAGDPFTVLVAVGTKRPVRTAHDVSAQARAIPFPKDSNMTAETRSTARSPARLTHPRARRRDGHDGAAPQADRGRLPRRAVHGPPARSEGQQRPPGADAARRDRRDPPRPTSRPAPTSSRPTASTARPSRRPTTRSSRSSTS